LGLKQVLKKGFAPTLIYFFSTGTHCTLGFSWVFLCFAEMER